MAVIADQGSKSLFFQDTGEKGRRLQRILDDQHCAPVTDRCRPSFGFQDLTRTHHVPKCHAGRRRHLFEAMEPAGRL
jgi:hypothetical protein